MQEFIGFRAYSVRSVRIADFLTVMVGVILPASVGVAPVTGPSGTEGEERHRDRLDPEGDVRRIVNVKGVHVFDIAQTDAEPLPELSTVHGDPAGYTTKLKGFIASKSIVLEYAPNLGGGLGMSSGGKITILEGQTPAAEFSVLAHELAHELLHRGERRKTTTKAANTG